ncbi:MAG: ABC transporter permease subunit [Lachnospiraceae bacterium]
MINTTLFRKELKSNWIMFIIFIGIIAMYSVMVVMMFEPEMSESLQTLADSMPEIFAAFGMSVVGTTLLEFITGYLYGMILVLLPAVFIMLLCGRLVARYVSGGSMAYLLAAPVKRKHIVTSQAVFLLVSLLAMAILVIGLIWGPAEIIFPGELELEGFFRINVGMVGAWIFIGGICFLVSCIFNDSKQVSAVNAGIIIYSYLMQMISQVGDKFEALKYATPLTLFNAQGLAASENGAWVGTVVLYGVGIVFMIVGIRVFSKRNLPL